MGIDDEKRPRRGQFLPISPDHSRTIAQENGENWIGAAVLQPKFPKSDRLPVMPPSKSPYSRPADTPSFAVRENNIEYGFIGKLQSLKYKYRTDIRDRAALEKNFREKFEALNRAAPSARSTARGRTSPPTTSRA